MFRSPAEGEQVQGELLETVTHSAEETEILGTELAHILAPGDVVLLSGDLGAGKTRLAHGMALALGARNWRGSPTFNLVHEYATRPPLYHADLYRLGESDVEELGLEEYARPESLLVIEWPERAIEYLQELGERPPIQVSIEYVGRETRRITVERGGSAPEAERAR